VKSPAARKALANLRNVEYLVRDISRSVEDDAYLLSSREDDEDLASRSRQTAVQSVIVRRKDAAGANAPLILLPHGGPHTACVASFVPSVAYLASLGYVVAYCNYRGSTGYGELSLQSLVGAVGARDVDDCVAVARRCVNDGVCHPNKIGVLGGSHGGFIGGHLVGQRRVLENPKGSLGIDFKCAVLRNPVTDIAAMVASTDIPDWCFAETVGIDAYSDVPDSKTLEAMRAVSPIHHVAFVAAQKRKVLLLIGAVDLRVPPANGLRYASALRALGGICRVRVFPEDAHGLVRPRTEFESFVAIAAFLRETLRGVETDAPETPSRRDCREDDSVER
jgi:acylaminoacyl-peptidase